MKTRLGTGIALAVVVSLVLAVILAGCGGATRRSAVSGTVADVNRNVIIDAEVWTDNDHVTRSLVSGAYRLEGVESGWRNVRARAVIDGQTWTGSTAAEVLRNEPTMNINIVLSPARSTTQIGGLVTDDTGRRVSGARVLFTTRIVYPLEDTSAYDGPYGSIVAVTDSNGRYLLEDVPVGLSAIASASKVGFRNREIEVNTITSGMVVNFTLTRSNLTYSPDVPILTAIESYTMPDVITRSDEQSAYKAIRSFTSERYRQAILKEKPAMTRSTPPGSLIETDLYWNALDLNDSRNIAGYGIYRTLSPTQEMRSIDFVRDPYANFYGDTGVEITPYQNYYYAVTSVDVEFLDANNQPDPAAESNLSNTLSVKPLGQLKVLSPVQGDTVTGDPVFRWTQLTGVDWYAVYVYNRFPTLPLDPGYDYGSDPAVDAGVFPIWPRRSNPNESTVSASAGSIRYTGPALSPGTYYWVVLAGKTYSTDNQGSVVSAAYSYSQLRRFTVR